MAKATKKTVTIPADATVRTLSAVIPDPVAYVRAVMRNMANWDAVVRIDISSDPKRPAYFLEQAMDRDEDGEPSHFVKRGWFDGRHKPGDAPSSDVPSISSVSMTRYEIQCLLADLLGQPYPEERNAQSQPAVRN